jgi:hypothetical protein
MSKDAIHKRGKQFCLHCDKETFHTPKLGLVMQGKRLCEQCNRSNDFASDSLPKAEIKKSFGRL